MSASVDVLAVLDRASGMARTVAGLSGDPKARKLLQELASTRDAVSELIEASDAYVGAEAALANREYDGINAEPYEKLQSRVHHARHDLEAALARVGGAK